GADQQHQGVKGGDVAEAALALGQRQQLGAFGDASYDLILQDHVLAVLVCQPGFVAGAEEDTVGRTQGEPPWPTERGGGFGAVVIHPGVELLDRGQDLPVRVGARGRPARGPVVTVWLRSPARKFLMNGRRSSGSATRLG